MKTRFHVDDYRMATQQQRSAVDAYLAELGRPLRSYGIVQVDATAEGTVRIERYLGTPGTGGHRDETYDDGHGWQYIMVRETLPSPVPPPWLMWSGLVDAS